MLKLTESGRTAISQVKARIQDEATLRRLMGGDADISSCNATANVLCEIITRGQSRSSNKNIVGGNMPQQARVQFIAEKLEKPNLVYVEISPDHHFVVFPIDKGQVALLQGFQGVYTLLDWMSMTNQGTYGKAMFIEQLGQLVQEGGGHSTRAAERLFSFNIVDAAQRDEPQKRQAVRGEISEYFSDRQPRIKTIAWWSI